MFKFLYTIAQKVFCDKIAVNVIVYAFHVYFKNGQKILISQMKIQTNTHFWFMSSFG